MMMCVLSLLLPTNWIVDAANGPGTDFTDLPAAVAAASDGDTIFVRAGTYTGFSIVGKTLQLRGDGAAVVLVGDASPGVASSVAASPAGQVSVCSGMRFFGTRSGLRVGAGGHVVLLSCAFDGAAAAGGMSFHGLELADAGEVFASRCTMHGGNAMVPGTVAGAGVFAAGGTLVVDECDVAGGDTLVLGSNAGPALHLVDARARVDRSQCTGGYAGQGGYGILATGTSFVRIAGDGSAVVAGGLPWVGGPNLGIVSTATGVGVELHGPVGVTGGTAGTIALAAELPRVSVTGGVLPSGDTDAGQTVSVLLDGLLPGAPYLFVVSTRPLFTPASPPLVGDLLFDTLVAGWYPGALDAAGRFQFGFLPVAVFGGGAPFPIYAQAAVMDPATGDLRLSDLDGRFYSL